MTLALAKLWPSFPVSKALQDGGALNGLSGNFGSSKGITAAGTTQTDAAPIVAANVEVLSGSANNAGLLMPPSYPGLEILVLNNSANTTKLWPNGTDQIQNGATGYAGAAASVSMATLVAWKLRCVKTGFWQRFVSA